MGTKWTKDDAMCLGAVVRCDTIVLGHGCNGMTGTFYHSIPLIVFKFVCILFLFLFFFCCMRVRLCIFIYFFFRQFL